MKQLLLALLLSIGLVNAVGVIDRLESALRSEDRATLEPFFYDTFTFETSYDHDGDANEAIDWILNRTIHGPFESLIMSENENSYEVDAKFYGTDIQLLLSLNKTTELIYVGSFQTHVEVVEGLTTTTSAPAPVITPQQWYLELLQALRQKSKEALSSLIGSTYFSHMTRERILSILLKDYETIKLIKRNETDFYVRITYVNEINTFFILANYDDQNGVSIRQIQFVNTAATKTTTTTSTLAPVITPQQWYLELLQAMRQQNKDRILELLGNDYSSTLSQEQILNYLLNGFESARKKFHGSLFEVEFDFNDMKTLRITGSRVEQQRVEAATIELIDKTTTTTLAPSTTTAPLIEPQQWYDALIAAIRENNKERILQLLGNGYKSQLSQAQILHYLLYGFENVNKKYYGVFFDVEFQFKSEFSLRISCRRHYQRKLEVVSIELRDPENTTTAPSTPRPVKTALNFYIEIRKAIGEQDKSRILELLGKKYLSFLTEERILSILLSKSSTVQLKRLTRKTFDVIFNYNGQQSLKIHCKDTSKGVTVTFIGLFDRTSSTSTTTVAPTTTSKPVTTPEEFYNALSNAVREKNKARVVELLGKDYLSVVPKEEIVAKLLTNSFIHSHLKKHNSEAFDVIFEYKNEQELTIHCDKFSRGIKVVFIRLSESKSTTPVPVPTISVSTPKGFYIALIDALRDQNRARVVALLGNNYKSQLSGDQILYILLSNYYSARLENGADNQFDVIFTYVDDHTLIIRGNSALNHVTVNYITYVQTSSVSTTPASPVTTTQPWVDLTKEQFYKKIVRAVDKKDKEQISELLGASVESNLKKEEYIEMLSRNYFNSTLRTITVKNRFSVTFRYTELLRIVIFGEQSESGIRIFAVWRYLEPEPTYETTTAPSTTPAQFWLPMTRFVFYKEMIDAVDAKNKERISELIGRNFHAQLEREVILEFLTHRYSNISYKYFSKNRRFLLTFQYPDESQMLIFGQERTTNSVRCIGIYRHDASTTLAPTTTTPCSVAQQQKLLAKFHKTMGEWEASIALNDSNHLSSLIDDNFKMIHDKEGTESNKARLIRALFEGQFRFYTPQENLQVEIESGLIKIKGQSKKYDATLWFREEEKALILVKAYYDKDVFKRKNALGFD